MASADIASHQATLALVAECAAYLRRLPVIPATRLLMFRLEEHLESPEIRHIASADLREQSRASAFSAAGLELLRAELTGDELCLRIPSVEFTPAGTPVPGVDPDIVRSLQSEEGLLLSLKRLTHDDFGRPK